MIWPFRPRCPLDVHNKVWTEGWLGRLAADFGVDQLLTGNDVFDTAGRIFGERDLFEGDTKAILSAICERMRFDPDRFSLQPEPPEEKKAPVTHGRWEVDDDGRYVVEVKDIDAGGLELQIAMLARLVGCALLNERGSFNPDELNDWWRAELTAVAMGFGPMIGNMTLAVVPSALGEAYGVPKKLLRYGYLPSHVTGYALAVLCWLGGDNQPGCGSKLRRDAADSYRLGLRYLHRTGDCLVQPDNWGRSIKERDVSLLLSDLSSSSESRRLAAIWDLLASQVDAGRAIDAVTARLQDSNPTIRQFAAAALCKWGADAKEAESELRHTIGSERDDKVCMQAVWALGVICEAAGISGEERGAVLDELLDLKERTRNQRVRDTAFDALSRLRIDVEVLGPDLARAIRDAIADAADSRLQMLLECVRRVEPDVERFLEEHFSERDPELLSRARAALREPRRADPYAGLPKQISGSIVSNARWA